MSKFKVGDKVVRTGLSAGKALQGGLYEISEVFPLISNRLGINLEGHEPDENTRFQYYSSGFELYIDDVLTPLEAADAILKEEKLQIYDNDCDKWYTFTCGHRNITIEDLKHIKLRLKPKTVVINDVEVPAPMTSKEITNCLDRRVGYYIDLAHKHIYNKRILSGQIVWATLIPFNKFNEFNELNKGEKL